MCGICSFQSVSWLLPQDHKVSLGVTLLESCMRASQQGVGSLPYKVSYDSVTVALSEVCCKLNFQPGASGKNPN